MTYRCLGNDQYEIKLTIFRDCYNGIPWFDDPASIGVFSNATNQYIQQLLVPLDPSLNDTIVGDLDDCLVEPPDVCVNTTTYTTVAFLPFLAGGYHLSYQRCCRNNTIINLVMPEDVGATYSVILTEEAMLECNASPEFNEWPPLFLCANLPFEIDQSAFDSDGDSLVYKLCAPLTGASDINPQPQPPNPPPYTPVPWSPSYGVDNMLNPSPAASMIVDPQTGLLTGTPSIIGQFVIGVCIEEYRDGEMIGEYRRDYQVNVGDCQATVAAFASADGIVTCGSKTVNFENQSTNANEFLWIFNDPNNPGATSDEFSPTYIFTDWGTYEVTLIAEPGDVCSDTTTVEISVQPNSASADFEFELDACLENVLVKCIDLSTDTSSAIIAWDWTLTVGPDIFTSSEQNPTFEVTPPGGAILTLIATNAVGCADTIQDIFPLKPFLLNLDLGPDIDDCQIGMVVLDAGEGFESYLWSDMSSEQTLTVNTAGIYSVTVTDACGDTAADQVTISISGLLIDAGADADICEGQNYDINVDDDFDSYTWAPTTGLSCSDCPNPTASPTTTTTYTVTGMTTDGCVSSDTVTINVFFDVFTSEDIQLCDGDFIIIAGDTINSETTIETTYSSYNGCDSVHTVAVSILDNIETAETEEICQGQTIIVFGNPVSAAGVFSETFTAQNGCDSIHTVTVNLLPAEETSETIGICEGISIDIFGNQVSDAGIYSETFTSQNGCDSIHTIVLEVYPTYNIIDDKQICEGETIIVFGNPVSTAGEYTNTLQTVSGCDSILTVNVAVLPLSFSDEERSICFGETTDIFGQQVGVAGVYDMVFTGANGCDSTHTITLEIYDEIIVNLIKTDASCFGLADGTATALVSGGNGGFSYEWSNGDVDAIATDLPAGDHSVTVTDAMGCTAIAGITVEQPPLLEPSITGTNVSCTQLGFASVSATGGTGAYSYEWSTGETTTGIDSLTSGSYTVTVTDENNCKSTASIVISGELAPVIAITIDQQLTEDNPNGGELSVAIAGGITPYTIEWSNGSSNDSLFNLSSGQYIVTVTDAQGCAVMDTAQLFVAGCTGGKIWNDRNRDGCQDGGEYGFPDVTMNLLGVDIWGNDVTATAISANNGEYIFEGLPPGEYLIFMDTPDGYLLSPPDNCTDDFIDSDFDVAGVATDILFLDEGHCCLIYDGGLYDDCLNVADAGTVCCDQTLCGPGNIAAPITSTGLPTGANQVEYRWIYSESTPNNVGGSAWSQVLDAFGNPIGTTSLNPGPVYTTTYYARCVRAIGCTEWLVTEIVTITVDDDAVATIEEPGPICVDDAITFNAADNDPNANYLWNFGPYATPQFSNEASPTVVFNQANYSFIYLTVTNNGCMSSSNMLIAVSDDPTYCGSSNLGTGGTNANGISTSSFKANDQFTVYPNPVTDKLSVEWTSNIHSTVQVEILSMDGKTVLTDKIGENTHSFQTDVNHLNAGIYMLRLRHSDGEQEVFKLVKQ